MNRRRRRRRPVALANLGDRDLLEVVAAGSRAALWELFNRHGAAVHQLAGLVAADDRDADRVVEEVFVTLARSGRLEDDVESVRLGLLAMAWRRAPAPSAAPASASPASASPLRGLPDDTRDALALTMLASAPLTDVARVMGANRQVVASRLRSGLVACAGQRARPAS